MQRLCTILLDNIRNVSHMETYPTHKLRILHQDSCLPEILHENRGFSSFRRILTYDSRIVVLEAIERTLQFILDITQLGEQFTLMLREYASRFERGVATLNTYYEKDMYVTMVIERILATWKQIMGRVACDIERE